ncbi:hypothetical protein SADUNF_Sadunf17G0004000 [Salix dunnii]|uniref:Uncharacterized protein n=1 Tax=Salix dunnii TaxID=1413687 RepID=A0A835J4V7_9ROSI|nr:hypothetical protein SADUNF_Sadunf17G0004000 [Salix dunnii]
MELGTRKPRQINYNLKRVFPLLFGTVEAVADVEHTASPPERVMLPYDFKSLNYLVARVLDSAHPEFKNGDLVKLVETKLGFDEAFNNKREPDLVAKVVLKTGDGGNFLEALRETMSHGIDLKT